MSCLEIKVVSKVRQNQLFLSTTQNAVFYDMDKLSDEIKLR